jgi:hypothetical protein
MIIKFFLTELLRALRDSRRFIFYPALKRRAILKCPSGTELPGLWICGCVKLSDAYDAFNANARNHTRTVFAPIGL